MLRTRPEPARAALLASFQHLGVQTWRITSSKSLTLDRPRVLAILNLTPDSFSDGGQLPTPDAALRAAERALQAGAAGLDVGGESTRPGALPIFVDEQIRRVVPAIRLIRQRLGDEFVITVDTTRTQVAQAAFDAGADALNDVSALRDDPGMVELLARERRGVILMHRLVRPSEDRYSTEHDRAPAYRAPNHSAATLDQLDSPLPAVVASVRDFLRERCVHATALGIARESIVIDPGLGFGKSVAQNLDLIRHTDAVLALGFPVLSALSRKSFVGALEAVMRRRAAGDLPARLPNPSFSVPTPSALNDEDLALAAALPPACIPPPQERVAASVRLSIEHLRLGARLFRVHDVAEHAAALNAG